MSDQVNSFPPANNTRIDVRVTDSDLSQAGSNSFARYQNFRPLAQGGSATLQLCHDSHLGRTVVMKTLDTHLVHNDTMRARFLREARVTAQLQHPGTVPVYEIGQDNEGRLYFTMKRLEGSTLRQILDLQIAGDQRALDTYGVDNMVGILIEICQVLDYAHTHGVVHRDVKPENIFVGIFGEVLVLDWGVAKVWDTHDPERQELEHEVLTDVDKRTGTPLYMAPEQIRGGDQIDARTDVYGVGVVLYEILTLTEPHRGENVHETFEQILHQEATRPEVRSPQRPIPAKLSAVAMQALEKDPARRFQSMREMIDALQACRGLERLPLIRSQSRRGGSQ